MTKKSYTDLVPELQKLGQFNLLEEIGHGGMGVVFRAFDPILNREVALKILREELSQDPKFLADFIREARAAAAISHPYIVQVHSVATEAGRSFIVMERLYGRTLGEIIEKDGSLNEERALDLAINITEALRAAYKNNQMIHGDIKPANIFLTDELGAKVLDFGLAKLANVETTSDQEIWGSPYYISPERVGRKAEDFRSDVYSLGATLFHALAGRPPFDADTPAELATKRLNEKPPLLRSINPKLTAKTEQVINKMLNKNILLRYMDYDAVLEDLREAKTEATAKRLGVDLHPEPHPVAPPAEIRKESAEKSKTPIFIGWLVAVLLITGMVVVVMSRQKPKEVSAPLPQPMPPPVVVTTTAPPVVLVQPPPKPTTEDLVAKRIAEEDRQRILQTETNLILTADMEGVPLLEGYDFVAILARYNSLEEKMTFPETKNLLHQRVTTIRWLVKFKEILLADIARSPYGRGDLITRTANPVVGTLVGATATMISVKNPYGTTEKAWKDLAPESVGKLAQFYIAGAASEMPSAVARRQLAYAVFCKQYEFHAEAIHRVLTALQLDSSLQGDVVLIWGKVSTALQKPMIEKPTPQVPTSKPKKSPKRK